MKKFIKDLYVKIFSKKQFYKINNYIINISLKARGYNNYENSYQSGEKFFLEKILSKFNPKLCIDIGANKGDYTINILKNTSATVISFEPLSQPYEVLKNRTKDFGLRSIKIKKGVGIENTKKKIYFNADNTTHASFLESIKKIPYIKNESHELVEITTLDEYFKNQHYQGIDFIKIDTEGYEYEVLAGSESTIKNLKPKFIQIEFNLHQLYQQKTLNYFSEILNEYDVYQLIPNGWIKINPKDPISNIYIYSNFIFVSRADK